MNISLPNAFERQEINKLALPSAITRGAQSGGHWRPDATAWVTFVTATLFDAPFMRVPPSVGKTWRSTQCYCDLIKFKITIVQKHS